MSKVAEYFCGFWVLATHLAIVTFVSLMCYAFIKKFFSEGIIEAGGKILLLSLALIVALAIVYGVYCLFK